MEILIVWNENGSSKGEDLDVLYKRALLQAPVRVKERIRRLPYHHQIDQERLWAKI